LAEGISPAILDIHIFQVYNRKRLHNMTIQSTNTTIRDVARLAGVSVATVSRFINHAAIVSPEVENLSQTAGCVHQVPGI
jgi:hypothetical protein